MQVGARYGENLFFLTGPAIFDADLLAFGAHVRPPH
jgi:hypothetical protein